MAQSTVSFGITMTTELRKRLERIAEKKGIALNRLINDILSAFGEADPRTKLEVIKQRATQAADEALAAELQAAQAIRETLRSKVEGLRAEHGRLGEEISELRRRILADPNALPEALSELRARLAKLEAERESLTPLLNEAAEALADAERELDEIQARWSEKFRVAFETPAFEVLGAELQQTARALAELCCLALEIVGTTRSLETVGMKLRLLRYLEFSLWASIARTADDPTIVQFANSKLFGGAFHDWARVCGLILQDFPPLQHVDALRGR